MWSSFWLGLRVPHVDLVWGTSPPIFQAVTAWLLARLKGARFLFEIRDLWPLFAVAVGVLKSRVLIVLSEWLERFLVRRADCIMVNSPGFIPHIRSLGASRIELVPNGADPSMFEVLPADDRFRREHDLVGKFVVLYAGAHGMSNDLGVVLDAARLVTDPGIQFVLVGDGKDKPALITRARSLRLSNVTFVGSLPKREMPRVLGASDACLAILKPLEAYKTTYPNKVFDYMAAARPVVLAIDGAIREVVENAHCGLFVRPGDAAALADAVSTLAGHPDVAQEMGRHGREYLSRHFSRDQIAARLVEVLESTLAGS
jgi:glycosyltransferase involved in cell wall biosynthesis